MIQSLENFVSMVIQGIQVPMYTKHTFFVCIFQIFQFFLYEKQNKAKLKNNQTKTDNHMKAERKMHMHEGMIEKCKCIKA